MSYTLPNIEGLAVINLVSATDRDALVRLLGSHGFYTIDFEGRRVHDKESFLRAASEQLLGGGTSNNWTSFADLWRSVIWDLDVGLSALIWTGAEQMLQGGLADLIDALDILTGVSRELYARNRTVVTFLVGNNVNFPPLRLT
jgi:hypothetical protein